MRASAFRHALSASLLVPCVRAEWSRPQQILFWVEEHWAAAAGGQALRSGSARGSGALRGLVELLDAGGELEVALGQPTLGVAGEDEGDLVPADVDVGVVAGRLGRAGDLVDERHRVGEVLAHERLHDLVAAPLPAGQALQALLDGVVVQQWHGPSWTARTRPAIPCIMCGSTWQWIRKSPRTRTRSGS